MQRAEHPKFWHSDAQPDELADPHGAGKVPASMARGTDARAPSDWSALRGELEVLLDQVAQRQRGLPIADEVPRQVRGAQIRQNSRNHSGGPAHDERPRLAHWNAPFADAPLADARTSPPTLASLSERLGGSRREQALQSVQKAVNRFNEKDEALDMPISSQGRLHSAIEQIRASQSRSHVRLRPRKRQTAASDLAAGDLAAGDLAMSEPTMGDTIKSSQARDWQARELSDLGQAVSQIGVRLERFESAFQDRASDQGIDEVFTQVEQLTNVVEMLANSVGERGNIHRVETQIARLAESVNTGPNLDFDTLNDRLDTLSQAFEQLSTLHTNQAKAQSEDKSGAYMRSISGGVSDIYDRLDEFDFSAIETSVRGIYDRIDSLEQNMGTSGQVDNPAIERLSRDLVEFTEALKAEKGSVVSSTMATRVDALNARLSDIETNGTPVHELQVDMDALREAVVSAIEPRFFSLETQIDTIGDSFIQPLAKVSENLPSLDALESQIRALSEKLEQTGSDISGLQSLYETRADAGHSSNGNGFPDIDAVADLVAERASVAITKVQKGAAQGQTLAPAALDAFEQRLERLFEANRQASDISEFSAMAKGIENVNDRLAQLEHSLNEDRRAQNVETTENGQPHQADSTQTHRANVDTASSSIKSNILGQTNDGPVSGSPDANAFERSTQPGRPHRHPGMGDEAGARLDVTGSQSSGGKPDDPAENSSTVADADDIMPTSPADEGPLSAPAFPAPKAGRSRVPVPSALLADPEELVDIENLQEFEVLPEDFARSAKKTSARKAKGGNDPDSETEPGPPPAPVSAFQASMANKTQSAELQGAPLESTRIEDLGTQNRVSQSTFIAAARRSAQAGGQNTTPDKSNSLIGRALARFQNKKSAKNTDGASEQSAPKSTTSRSVATKKPANHAKPTHTAAADSAADTAPDRGSRNPSPSDAMDSDNHSSNRLAPSSAPPAQTTSNTVPKAGFLARIRNKKTDKSPTKTDEKDSLDDLDVVDSKESLIARHSRPILLGAAVVAVSLLTFNLINQRLSSSTEIDLASANNVPPAEAIGDMSQPASAETTNPMNEMDAPDPAIVGSISQSDVNNPPPSGVRFIDPTPMATMPASLEPASLNMEQAIAPMALEIRPDPAAGPALMREAAANGDPRAQFEVGAIYAEGRALPQDLAQAVTWYERAAAQGFAPAAYRVANIYENGVGVPKDLALARHWYEAAAEAGNRMSMHNLAALLASGALGEQEFGAAAHWFERAAALGLTDSQFNLGMLHARGLGVQQNLEYSYRWFSIAAESGDPDAISARDDVARSLNAAIVAQLQTEVETWSPVPMDMRANFAPIGTWSADFDPGETIDNQEIIMRVQAALNRLGYDTGIPDGLIGPKTVEAISLFEEATGMSRSGAVNPRLLAVLGSQPV